MLNDLGSNFCSKFQYRFNYMYGFWKMFPFRLFQENWYLGERLKENLFKNAK